MAKVEAIQSPGGGGEGRLSDKFRVGVCRPQIHFFSFFISFSFKSYLKLVFTIVDNEILIHTNYLQERYTLYKRKNH